MVVLHDHQGRAEMPSAAPWIDPQPRYTMNEFRDIRRHVLRYARSCTPGPVRNQHRQIAHNLHRLFAARFWREHDVLLCVVAAPPGAAERGLRSVVV
jgi:hypothetical protein